MGELTEKINDIVKEKLFIDTSKYKNTVDLSNVEHINKDLKEEKTIKELIQKLLDADIWYHKQMRKNKPAIIIDSQGRYVNTYGYGTSSFLDYVKAVEEGQIKIKDKEYRKSILKFIENNK